jgi:uncharacterized protein YfaS (alpha-2-macroglobulin family)
VVKKFFQGIKTNKKKLRFFLVFLAIIFIFFAVGLSNTYFAYRLTETKFAPASNTYYQNFPVNDPLRIESRSIDPSRLKQMISLSPHVDVEINKVGDNLLEIKPQQGMWPRYTNIDVIFSKPFTFTTAGSFQVIQSIRGDKVNPQDGITVRFNYRLKNPESLKDHLTIAPEIPLTVDIEKDVYEKEVGMVYKISSKDMKYSYSYELVIAADVLSDIDESLGQPATIIAYTIANPNLPKVNVTSGSYVYDLIIFPLDDQKDLPLEIDKTDKVDIKLYEITPAQAINYFVYTQPDEDSYWTKEFKKEINLTNNTVKWHKLLPKSEFDKLLDLPNLPIGVYALSFTAEGGGETLNEYVIINVTELGAIASIGKFDTSYWVSSLKQGESISNAEVRVYKMRDGAILVQSGSTSDQGLVNLDNVDAAGMAVAFYDNDTALIPLDIPGTELSSSSPSTYWWYARYPSNETSYEAYLYSDRPIYKPGDTMYTKAIIRQDNDVQYQLPTGSFKMALRKNYWNKEEKPIWEKSITTNDFGTISEDIKLPESIKTGYYYLCLERNSDDLQIIGVYVDEYRKPLYQTTITTDKESFFSNEKISFNVKSTYTFGMPVKDREIEWAVYQKPTWRVENKDPYTPDPGYFGYSWWYAEYNPYRGDALVNGTSKLNANGEANISFSLDPEKLKYGNRTLTIEVIQKDEQLTLEKARKEVVYNSTEYLAKVVSKNQSYDNPSVTLKLTDMNNNPVINKEVELSVDDKKYKKETTNSDGLVTLHFKKEEDNYHHRLFFEWKDSGGRKGILEDYLTFRYTDDNTQNLLDFQLKEASVELTDTVKRGETTNLKVKQGGKKHLVVIGRETVIESFVVDDNSTKSFEISDQMMPNFYVYTYSFKDGALISGERSIEPTDLSDFKHLKVSVTADKNIYQPGDTANLEILTTDKDNNPIASEVSVSVVDKAIFQLKKKVNKPIHPHFYKRRTSKLVESNSLGGIKKFLGGGGGGGGGNGMSQLRSNFVDTAYNNPNIYTDSQGKASVSFKLPDNLTTWMMSSYAVSTQTEVGEQEGEFVVNKDVFAVPIFPQFVTNDDIPIFKTLIGNTTDSERSVKTSFTFGNEAPEKNPTQQISIPENQTKVVSWEHAVKTDDLTRQLSLLVTSLKNEILDGVSIDIPINKRGITVKSGISGIDNAKITPKLMSGADSDKSEVELYIHGSILGYVNEILSYQAGYPYGCVEQTMSKFYPTALVKANLNYLSIQNSDVMNNLDDMVGKGIEKLQKLQHSDGGWGLWEKDDSKLYYTSYVLNGLSDLEGSFNVPQEMIQGGKNYLEKALESGKLHDSQKVMILVPLSKLGSAKVNSIDFGDLSKLDDQELAEAAVAFATTGNSRTQEVIDLLKKRSVKVNDKQIKWNKGSNTSHFNHDNLTTALALQALLIAEPDSDLIQKGLNFINANKNRYVYGSTYTNAQVVKAFIGYVKSKGVNQSGFSVKVNQDGADVFEGPVSDSESLIGPIKIKPDKQVSITSSEDGVMLWEIKINNVLSGKLDARESDRFSIKRSYQNTGSHSNNSDIKVGDVFMVRLEVKNKKNEIANFLVLEDMLPAGTEAVKPYFDNEKSEENYYSGYSVERYKDRVVMFPYYQSGNNTVVYRYFARAFLPGKYVVNPANVSLMYSPEAPAFTSTEELIIKE